MRVNVIKAFPYSEHGWDNAQAAVGVQELPEHIAAAALAEGWAKPMEVSPVAVSRSGIPFASVEARDLADTEGLTLASFTGRTPDPEGFSLAFVQAAIAARDPRDAFRQPLLVLTRGKNVEESEAALQALTTDEQLLVVMEGELVHPDYPGGRKGVLAAIDARAEQLKTSPAGS